MPPRRPSVTPISGLQHISFGQPANFACRFPGSLPLNISWRAPSNLVLNSSTPPFTLIQTLHTETTSDNVPMTLGEIQISAVQRNMNGTFTCMATNAGGNREGSMVLIVYGKTFYELCYLVRFSTSSWGTLLFITGSGNHLELFCSLPGI